MTFIDSDTIGSNVNGIFISINNTVYIADYSNNRTLIWLEENSSLMTTISDGFGLPCSLFVTITGDIYIDNGYANGQVDKWVIGGTNSTPVMYINGACYGLFIDINNFLYCSMRDFHQVVMKTLNDSVITSKIVAGTTCPGIMPNMLYYPYGIFVDNNLNLYVADTGNNRIQLFLAGQLNGTTLVGNGMSGSILLSHPTGVVLDGNGYLFIVDLGNNRIIQQDPNGFRCLVGCSGSAGSGSDQLQYPQAFSFDSSGNMFIIDTYNNRVQKFLLATNSCGKYYNTYDYRADITPQIRGLFANC